MADPLLPTLPVGRAQLTLCDEAELLALAEDAVRAGRGLTIVTPNLTHLLMLERDPHLAEAYSSAEIHATDSTFILWLSRLTCTPAPARLAGADLLPRFLELAAHCDAKTVIVGGTPATAKALKERVLREYPSLRLTVLTPRMHFEQSEADLAEVNHQIRMADPKFLFVCLGAPRSEILAARLREELPGAVVGSFGAAIDFYAGTKRRAPVVMQRLGLEWAFRVANEPRRLAGRYVATAWRLPPLLARCLKTLRRSRRRSLSSV